MQDFPGLQQPWELQPGAVPAERDGAAGHVEGLPCGIFAADTHRDTEHDARRPPPFVVYAHSSWFDWQPEGECSQSRAAMQPRLKTVVGYGSELFASRERVMPHPIADCRKSRRGTHTARTSDVLPSVCGTWLVI